MVRSPIIRRKKTATKNNRPGFAVLEITEKSSKPSLRSYLRHIGLEVQKINTLIIKSKRKGWSCRRVKKAYVNIRTIQPWSCH